LQYRSKSAKRKTQHFGKGFDVTNLRNMRRFYLAFPIRDALRHELSWSHYNLLARQKKQQPASGINKKPIPILSL